MEKSLQLLHLFMESIDKKDDKAAAKYRQKILQLELDSQTAATAQYRLGLFVLNQENKLDESMEIFQKVASAHVDCDDVLQAKISYAICLWSKGKKTQSIFELRKVLSKVPEKSIYTLLALDYLFLILQDNKAPKKEIDQINTQRIQTLSYLLQSEKDIETQAALRLELATALEERGQLSDLEQARLIIKKVVDLAPKLSKQMASAAKTALTNLNKNK